MSKSDKSARFENKKYQALFENSISALFIIRSDGTILEANQAACRMFGYSEVEFVKIGKQDIIDPETPGLQKKLIQREETGTITGELIAIRKNGERFWCEFSSNIFEGAGSEKMFSMMLIDISDKKDAQERLKSVINNVPGIIMRYLIEPDGSEKLQYVSDGVRSVLGIPPDEILEDISLGWKNVHEDDIAGVVQSLNESAEKNTQWISEFRYHHPDGTIRWLRVMGNPVSNKKGRIVWDSMMIDITEEKQAEFNLKLMKSAVTEANDAVLITKAKPIAAPDGPEIIYVNRGFEKMTGYMAEEVIGKTPRMLQGANTGSSQLQKLRDAIRKQESVEVELLNYSKNGEEYWINISLSPIFEGDKCTHFISIQRDVTDRKLRELQQSLSTEISQIFNREESVKAALNASLEVISELKHFDAAEFWLADRDRTRLKLAAHTIGNPNIAGFYTETNAVKSFKKGEGLPGKTWKKKKNLFWRNLDNRKTFIRSEAAATSGLKTAFSFPIVDIDTVLGVLVLFLSVDLKRERYYVDLFKKLSYQLASEINRKTAEEELSRIFSSAPDVICIAGLDGYYKKVNPAMSDLFGYSEKELLNTPILKFIHPDDRQRTKDEFEALNKGEGNHYFENRHITKTGQVIWLSWTTKLFYDEGITYSVAKDITEEKELRELLEQANRLSKIGSWEVDLVENKIYWSKITRKILDVNQDVEPSMDKGLEIYKKGESRKKMTQAIEQAIENGTPWDIEVQILTSSGREKWVRSIGESEMVDGRCLRLYGSLQDIHEKKSIELRLKNISNNFPGVLFQYHLDTDGNDQLFYVSEGSKDLWGVTPDKAMSDIDFLWNRFHKGDLGKVIDSIKNSAELLTKWQSQWRYHHPDGSVRWHEGVGTPQKFADGSFLWDSVILDVTERKRADETLKELNRILEQQTKDLAASNAELEQFAFVASHDLQEPLRMITSFLAQLERKYGDQLDEKGKKYIHFATDGAKRMRQIILDLLDYSRVGRTDTDKDDVDINKILDVVTGLHNKLIQEKKAKVTWEKMPVIRAARGPVQQLFQNLVHNALSYQEIGKRPVVKIRSEETDDHWTFYVQDNGIGIDPEYKDKIFNIFQRLHGRDEYSGTGVGLAICKKIVEDHGGVIGVDSKEGKGSTFYFTIAKTVEKDL